MQIDANLTYAILFGIVGLFFLLVPMGMGKGKGSQGMRNVFTTLGVITIAGAIVIGGMAVFGIIGEDIEQLTPVGVGESDWDLSVGITSGYTHVQSISNSEWDYRVLMNHNHTSGAFVGGTQWVSFDVSGINSGDWSQVVMTASDTGFYDYSAGGSGATYSILNYYNGKYAHNYTVGSTTYTEQGAFPTDANTYTGSATVNLTARAPTVDLMSADETAVTTITFTDSVSGEILGTLSVTWDMRTIAT